MAAGIWLAWLNGHYFQICPIYPDAQTGHVFPLDNRGHFVYLTAAQNRFMVAAESAFFACIATGAIAEWFYRRSDKKDSARGGSQV
jgi:hypothetical protein